LPGIAPNGEEVHLRSQIAGMAGCRLARQPRRGTQSKRRSRDVREDVELGRDAGCSSEVG
jgi:hypothetical protein